MLSPAISPAEISVLTWICLRPATTAETVDRFSAPVPGNVAAHLLHLCETGYVALSGSRWHCTGRGTELLHMREHIDQLMRGS